MDGHTGQNALAQVKAFDAAVGLTGLVVTKLDGTAKGGVLAAIAAGGQAGSRLARAVPVYFIGVGEKLEDLETFDAREFAQALLDEAITLFVNGEPESAKLILRDLVNATVGFEALAEEIHKPAKSLHRMLSQSGNPTMSNISAVFAAIKRALKVEVHTQIVTA